MILYDFLDIVEGRADLTKSRTVEIHLVSDKTHKPIDTFKVTFNPGGKRAYDAEDKTELARNMCVPVMGWDDGNPLTVYLEW